MKCLRIVIVTYNWPPRNAIGTHRPYSWARYWSEAGAQVKVLTAAKYPFDAPMDLHLPALPGVEVIEVPYGGAARLMGKALRLERLRWLARKVKRWMSRQGVVSVDLRAAWRDAARPAVQRLAREADIVVSTFGPAASHLIASDMKRVNPSLRWVADYRDLWSQGYAKEATETKHAIARKQELESVGERADLLTAVSNDMVHQLSVLTGKPVIRMPNGFDLDETVVRQRLAAIPKASSKPFRIVHTGMLYEGHRDPKPLLEALVKLKETGRIVEGDITVDFYGARVDVARQLARDPLIAPFIRLMGHVSRDDALAAQCHADLLLLLESPAPEARGTLTGKLFEYITAGRPIICIGSLPEYEIGQLLAATGTGAVFGPEQYDRLPGVLDETMQGGGLFASYAPNVEEVLRYSRKRLAGIMLSEIHELMQ